MRTNFSILLFLFVAAVIIQSSRPKKESDPLNNAKMILKTLDKALESHKFGEFLEMHVDNFHFNFCNVTGKSRSDLKKILETDPNMSETFMSKHQVKTPTGTNGVTKVSGNMWKFGYEEHLVLKNKEVYRTEGIINFINLGTQVKVVSATEECPVQVL